MAKFFDWFGVYDNIEFLKIKYAIRAVFPEHDIRLPSGDLESVIAVLEESFPAEKDDIRKLFKEMVNVYEDIMKFFYSTAPMWQQLPVFPFRYKSLFSVMKKTVKEILDKHLKNNKLKAILFANYGFYGLPPSRLSVLGLCANVDYWMQGAFYPKGGNQMIPNAFVDIIKQNHGEILLGSEVAHIIVERNKVIGVVTKKGDKYFGKNVVSNASAIETFYNLVGKEKVPEKFIEKIDRMESSDSGFRVCLGLDDAFKLEPKNIDDYEILVSDTYDQDVDYEWICNCDVEHASFFITLYSNIDVSLAKRNGFVMSLMQKQPYSYWKKFETSYNAGNKEDYNKEKDKLASILIKRAEKIIPNISNHIEVIEIATPLTLKRYTGNFNGALYGWANTPKQFTPMDRLAKTPIKNFYLSSAWTFPGEGQATTVACGCRLGKQLARK